MSDQLPEKGFHVLESWSTLYADGNDAEKFLNSFCTNDVTKLEVGKACEAFFTDVKAHILAYTYILKSSETSFTIVLSSSGAGELLTHLDRYLIREEVELSLENERVLFTTDSPLSLTTPRIPITAIGKDAGVSLLQAESSQSIKDLLTKEGYSQIELADFELVRIQRGIPLDQRDINSENLPQEVDRVEQTISFHKGCYLGQEPVARIDALGQVNWLLRQIKGPIGLLNEGESLSQDGKVVAKVRSVASTEAGSIALGFVRRQFVQDGTQIETAGEVVTVHTIGQP